MSWESGEGRGHVELEIVTIGYFIDSQGSLKTPGPRLRGMPKQLDWSSSEALYMQSVTSVPSDQIFSPTARLSGDKTKFLTSTCEAICLPANGTGSLLAS